MNQPLLCDLPGWCQPMALLSLEFLLICGAEQRWGQACAGKLISRWETDICETSLGTT